MSVYEITGPALADLDGILALIAQDRPRAAAKLLDRLVARFERIAQFPNSGRPRAGTPLRIVTVAGYLVAYSPSTLPVQIVRVLHRRRDMEALLKGETPQ